VIFTKKDWSICAEGSCIIDGVIATFAVATRLFTKTTESMLRHNIVINTGLSAIFIEIIFTW
jgi:hypothetical protein